MSKPAKKPLDWLLLVLLSAALPCGAMGLIVFRRIFEPEFTSIREITSPDGRHTAALKVADGGATTDWAYHVMVNGQTVFIADNIGKPPGDIHLQWNGTTLEIDHPNGRVFQSLPKAGDAQIIYKTH